MLLDFSWDQHNKWYPTPDPPFKKIQLLFFIKSIDFNIFLSLYAVSLTFRISKLLFSLHLKCFKVVVQYIITFSPDAIFGIYFITNSAD